MSRLCKIGVKKTKSEIVSASLKTALGQCPSAVNRIQGFCCPPAVNSQKPWSKNSGWAVNFKQTTNSKTYNKILTSPSTC